MTGWLLLLVMVASSHGVDSQSTTDEEVCDRGLISKLQQDIDTLMSSQQRMFQQLETVVNVKRNMATLMTTQQEILQKLEAVVNNTREVDTLKSGQQHLHQQHQQLFEQFQTVVNSTQSTKSIQQQIQLQLQQLFEQFQPVVNHTGRPTYIPHI